MKPPTILIVEDDYDILRANRTALVLKGYSVLEADTLKKGRRFVKELSPDLIILDILLPDGNGLAYCEELRGKNDVPILFLSALNTKKDVLAGLRAGGDDYMSKPYDMDELILRVDALLRRTKLMRLKGMQQVQQNSNNHTLRIISFGGFHIYAGNNNDNEPVKIKFRTNKALELLAFLHSYRGKPVHQSIVLDSLFEDTRLKKAKNILYLASYYLRKALKSHNLDNIVNYTNSTFTLDKNCIKSDLIEFEDCFAQYKSVNKDNILNWEYAANLYRGEYVAFCEYPWAEEYRAYLGKLYMEGLFKMMKYYDRIKDRIKYLNITENLLRLDPLNEEVYESLISSCLQSGDRKKALESYERLKKNLWDELNIKPRKEINDLLKSHIKNS